MCIMIFFFIGFIYIASKKCRSSSEIKKRERLLKTEPLIYLIQKSPHVYLKRWKWKDKYLIKEPSIGCYNETNYYLL